VIVTSQGTAGTGNAEWRGNSALGSV
jgi:hypothetical protein